MNRFWDIVIYPILNVAKVKKIVEVGSDAGWNTSKLVRYCKHRNGVLTAIDPFPQFDVAAFKAHYGKHFQLIQNFSLKALPKFGSYEAILIDGDHNWYTVYHELKCVEKMARKSGKFPIVFLHDIGWPYGRRDMYYNPDTIPLQFRKPYAQKGMMPGVSELVEQGGINTILNNAVYEHGEKNGVLTAIEDFLKHTKMKVSFFRLESHHGLGVIVPQDGKLDYKVWRILHKSRL